MWYSGRATSSGESDSLVVRLSPLVSKILQNPSRPYVLVLLVFIFLPRIGLAQENYFQIINGSVEPVNNTFLSDRGYSVYFSFDGKRFLYDVGQKKKSFLNNLKSAGIPLDGIDFVVMSHPHSDHKRGWGFLRKEQPSLPIYVPSKEGYTSISEPTVVTEHLKISPNIFIIHTHDDSGSLDIFDELSLTIITKDGPYLFTTNSHTDFFKKLEKAKRVTGQEVFFHSGHTARRISPNDLIATNARRMKELGVKRVSPSHSSPRHDRIFKEVYGNNYLAAILGKKVVLEPAY